VGRISYLIALAALLAACSPTSEATQNTAALKPAAPVAKPCPEPDTNSACKADTHDLEANFIKAMLGDYEAQRNTAWSFNGSSPYVEANLIQSCAWRKVIVASQSEAVTFRDTEQLRLECEQLGLEELKDAEKLAEQIQAAITAK
jgi:hypothetical protein